MGGLKNGLVDVARERNMGQVEGTDHSHCVTYDIDHCLVGQAGWVGEEEEAQRDVEEAEGGNDRFGGY